MAEKLNKDKVYRSAKPKEKDYFINDGGGLCLFVRVGGAKLWRFMRIEQLLGYDFSSPRHDMDAVF